MSKKSVFSIMLALMAAVLVVGSVGASTDPLPFADKENPFDKAAPGKGGLGLWRPGRGVGQVTAIGEDQFTLVDPAGEEHVVLVNEDTQFRSRDGEEITFADLAVGRWVAGRVRSDEDGALVARVVILLPEDFDIEAVKAKIRRGEVTAVDAAGSSFTLAGPEGEAMTILTNADTVFQGIEDLSEMTAGMQALAVVEEQEDGALLAGRVLAGEPGQRGQRYGGVLLSVDADGNSFSITTRDGTEVAFIVDENTNYRSPNDELRGLANLEEGMVVIVMAQEQENGSLLAGVVGVVKREAFAGERVVGTAAAVGADSLTIENADGEQITLAVTAETRFFSRNSEVKGLEDIEEGVRIGATYETLEDGTLQAKGVLVGRVQGGESL